MSYKLVIFICKITVIYGLTCNDLLERSEKRKISMQDLQTTPPKELIQCLAHLGKEQLGANEADFLWQMLITFYEGIPNIPEKVLMLLHWITPAIPPDDYTNITLSNIDVIQNFGLNYYLSGAQLLAIADRVREDFAGKEPEDYTYYDLTALRQILCAFNKSEIVRIHPTAYREAAITIGKLQRCNPEVLKGFAELAVQKKAFGTPAIWSDATIEIIGVVGGYVSKHSRPSNSVSSNNSSDDASNTSNSNNTNT